MSDYDFRSLSPTDFEYFVCDLLNTVLGLRLHSYPPGRDQGIDLRQVDAGDRITVAQCKHYAGSPWSTFRRAALKEADKPGAASADRYILATSFPLTPPNHAEIVKELRKLGLAVDHDDVWGPRALNDALGLHAEVERRHIKLWLSSSTVLEDFIHSRRWRRTEAILEDILDRVRLWVEPPAYAEALHTLEEEGICIVAGPPGAGKTFLAEMIALAAARDKWEVVHVASALEAWDLLRKDDTPRLFYYDDFLGQAELKPTASDEGPHLESFIDRVRKLRRHKRLIITSREQVLRQASLSNSESLARIAGAPMPHMIALSTYDLQTRAHILFNHLYFSDISDHERRHLSIDNRLINLVQHPSYNPRVVEAITGRVRSTTTGLELLTQLGEALDNPAAVFKVSFRALSESAKEVLLTMATLPARPIPLDYLRKLSGQPITSLTWKGTWQSLEPAWVNLTGQGAAKSLVFANPGCRDYVLSLLDDVDMASERVNRIMHLSQLVFLTQAAGLLPGPLRSQHRANRAELAHVLRSRSKEIASLIGDFVASELSPSTSQTATLVVLREAAALVAVYGTAETSAWLWDRLSVIERHGKSLPTVDGLALAAQLCAVPAETSDARDTMVRILVRKSVENISTLRDLDAYEALPSNLQASDIHEVAQNRAISVITSELDNLLGSSIDGDTMRDTGFDLKERAAWYGHEVEIDVLLDRVDDLMYTEESDPIDWPEAVTPRLEFKHESEAIRTIFRGLVN
ncbi:nSTAND3 domain-containing NTPase [Sphaerisporangium rhizosphaerae]|uniref:Restriction endonuclease n=1 Tax=Sphaerisporangium rhizosphaerae TaxID=2269375 RepID=A0ABW2P8D7_9ACTN